MPDTITAPEQVLAPLTIGQSYYVPKQAEMLSHGNATVTANPSQGVYEITYPNGVRETLTDLYLRAEALRGSDG